MALKLFARSKTSPENANTTGDAKAKGKTKSKAPPKSQRRKKGAADAPTAQEYRPAPRETLDSDPLKRLSQQYRFAVILQDERKWAENQGARPLIESAKQELEKSMALVPAGTVSIPRTLGSAPGDPEDEVEVEPFLLDIHCVTNERFQKFVDAGGYDELEYWPEDIWPHLIELKDLTGDPGPRFWRHGRHDERFSNHPVVGVSWYEAQAFSLWIGQRLPTESEWQMAASWHINSSADLMRRFPWGDAMDNTRCNIWSTRLSGTAPVSEFPNGAAPNHVLQLVGNVWEWNGDEYVVTDELANQIIGEMPMHVIRGGAFDTYFETQATSQFRTGQIALARTHNTGFRCAMNLSDASWINSC